MQRSTETEHTPEGVKIGYTMRPFIPNQGVIYNYFQIMKHHGFINEVFVYKERNRYRIGFDSTIPHKPTNNLQ